MLLALDPLVSSIAAGNTSVLKLSEYTPHTNELLARMIAERFSEDYVAVVQGGPEVARQLLHQPFDCIFFTGSPAIGKQVMHAAAERLVPVTLSSAARAHASLMPQPTSSSPHAASPSAKSSMQARPVWRRTTFSWLAKRRMPLWRPLPQR